MTIGSITGGSATSTSSLDSSSTMLAGNFDTFLQLLTAQLQNQNPLDPLDTNQFTQQLVQFSSVEQQLKTNQFLEALIQANEATVASNATTQALSFIGKEVTASTTLSDLSDGKATWIYNAETTAPNSIITVKDAEGNTVYTEEIAIVAGEHRFEWDGVGSDGETKEDGVYQIHIDARDKDGNDVNVTTEMAGTVDSVDFSGDEPFLVVGSAYIALSSVSRVNKGA
jgi:flagellar basal-body rod modification protein FlgD